MFLMLRIANRFQQILEPRCPAAVFGRCAAFPRQASTK
jgi:hypothetical protein